jgi:hypothetical protein
VTLSGKGATALDPIRVLDTPVVARSPDPTVPHAEVRRSACEGGIPRECSAAAAAGSASVPGRLLDQLRPGKCVRTGSGGSRGTWATHHPLLRGCRSRASRSIAFPRPPALRPQGHPVPPPPGISKSRFCTRAGRTQTTGGEQSAGSCQPGRNMAKFSGRWSITANARAVILASVADFARFLLT